MQARVSTRRLTTLALLAALSAALMFLDFPLPIFPGFLKLDFSDLPALLATFYFGPLGGLAVALVKNLIHLSVTQTAGVGELANFLVSAALVGTAGAVYRLRRTKSGAILAMGAGTVSMVAMGIIANYFILLPFYENFMPIDTVIQMCAKILPFVQTKLDVVLWSISPFNLFKGLLISAITFLVYKRLGGWLKRIW